MFRIEDTDVARDTQASYEALLDALRWLGGLGQGPEVGGPHQPYRSSERGEIYADAPRRLVEAGEVYESYSTGEEIEARHRAAGRDPKLGYDNADRVLTDEQRAALRAQGRAPVYRLRMPDGHIGFTDLVRGEDLLPSTPRQVALHAALHGSVSAQGRRSSGTCRWSSGRATRSCPSVPRVEPARLSRAWFVPEGLNYLALLGGAIAEDREVFSLPEMVEALISRAFPVMRRGSI